MQVPLYPRRTRVGLALAVAAAILVASVAPPPPGTGQPAGPLGLVGADKWVHALAYATLAGTVAYAARARSRRALAAAVLAAAAFGLLVEGLQLGLPARSFEVADAAVNAGGALLAAAGWRGLRVDRHLRPVDDEAGTR